MARCYLCNCTFADKKVYEHMFDRRYNANGIEQKTLANILAMVLGHQLQEDQLHSTFVCSTCKVSLLNYEAMENQLLAARREIIQLRRSTLELYEKQKEEDDYLSEDSSLLESDLIEEQAKASLEHMNLLQQCSEDIDLMYDTDDDLIAECDSTDEDDEEDELEVHFKMKPAGKQSTAQAKASCTYCGKTFARRQWLEEHERVHTGERPYKCDQCDATFAQRANFRTHRSVTHQNKANFKCNQCERSFKRKRLLDNHIKSKHTQLRDLKCEHCEATFTNPVNMVKHLLCHTGEKNYSCQICGKQFSRAENRNVHHFVHSIRKPYVCVVCDEGFMRKQQLQQHIAATQHPNPKIVRRKPLFSAANSDKLLQRPLSEANK